MIANILAVVILIGFIIFSCWAISKWPEPHTYRKDDPNHFDPF